MFHQGQRLPLDFEARDEFFGIEAELDDLQGNTAMHRLLLFGQIDLAEAARPKLLNQFVSADPFLE